MDQLTEILQESFVLAGAREDADWRRLSAARETIVSRADVPEVTARKWMSVVESGNEPVSSAANKKIVAKIAGWVGSEATTQWVDAFRNFDQSSRRVHRAGLELADHAGIDARLDLEGLRDEGALRQRLIAIAARINPTLDVHLPKELFAEGEGLVASGLKSTDRAEVAGMYEPARHLATISVAPRFDREDTAWHESWHSIEPVLTDKEASALQKAFPDNNHMTSPERVAVAFARWAKLRDRLPQDTSSNFNQAVTTKLRAALLPASQEPVHDIFEKAYDGTLGKRMMKVMQQTQPDLLQKALAKPRAAKTSASEEPSRQPAKQRRMRR